MKTLRKLFYVACTMFFLASCEETYNDKLFWPGELSQEYGSYIKPSTLDLTYSGEKLIGKTVNFQTEDSEKGTLTLNDIVPGEKEISIRVDLFEKKDNYTFSGETVSGAGTTVKYAGSITPKTMKLDLNVTMPQNQWIKTYQMSELTRGRGKDVIRNQTTGEYEWGESDNQILTAALYTDMDLEMVKDAGSLYATVSWPGELSQEYGSYIKPSTLDLTYSGEKLIGKTVNFQTEDSEKGTLTLNDIVPGEKEISIRVDLFEKKDNYTFSGETVSGAGTTVKYAGSITPKTMKLDLNVTMPQNQWIKTYQMSELTRGRGKDVIRNQTTGEYEWGESDNQILTAALYTDMDLEMVKDAGSLYATVSVIIKGMGGYLLPQLLKSVTLESDGNITAEYTSDELQLGEQKFSEIDMDNPASLQQVINFIMMKLMFNTLSADDITAATQGRNYTESPRGLAFWYLKNDLLYVKPDLPGIISLAMQGQGQTVDAHLIAGIADAILKSNPFLLKTLLGVVSESLDNSLLSMIAQMDYPSFQMFFSWIKEGIPMQIEKENGHTHIYLNREALSPLIAFIPNLQPVMEGIPNFGPMLYNSYLGPLYDNWSIITQLDLGLDLTDKNE